MRDLLSIAQELKVCALRLEAESFLILNAKDTYLREKSFKEIQEIKFVLADMARKIEESYHG